MKIQDVDTIALLDSGASVNVCSLALANHVLSARGKPLILQTANNENLPIIKKGFLCFSINNYPFKIYVYVTKSLSSPLILGDTFLTQAKAIINYHARTVSLSNNVTTFSIALANKKADKLSSIRTPLDLPVTAQITTILEPQSVTNVPIKCNIPPFLTNLFFHPNVELYNSSNIYMNNCRLQTNFIPVKNFSFDDIIIYENTKLGSISFDKNLEYYPKTDTAEKASILSILACDFKNGDLNNFDFSSNVNCSIRESSPANRKNTVKTAFPQNTHTYAARTASNPCFAQTNAIKMASLRGRINTLNVSRKVRATRIADQSMCIKRIINKPKLSIGNLTHVRNYYDPKSMFDFIPKEHHTIASTSSENFIDVNSEVINPENKLPTDSSGTPISIDRSLPVPIFQKIKNILENSKEVFASKNIELKKARILPAEINLTDDIPVHSPPFHLSPIEDEQIHEIISELKSIDVIGDSTSPYASPAFLVVKPGVDKNVSTKLSAADKRLVVDFRKINKKVIPDRYPLPRIDSLVTELRKHKYFSKFDFLSGFFQQELSVKSRKCSAFTTNRGLFEFHRQPMGMRNGTSSFSRALNQVFADLLYHGVMIFVDDLIIYSNTLEDHLKLLSIVFDRLKKHCLRLKSIKSKICFQSIDILGFHIEQNCITPSQKNLEPIMKSKTPSTLKELRSFLGSCTFFRKFIHNFAKICSPLYDLVRESTDHSFEWNPQADAAFKRLIYLFSHKPVLQNFQEHLETFVIVDSSKLATGSILAQRNPHTNKLHPIGFFSKKLQPQPSWSVTELELQGLSLAVTHFREFLYGRRFTVLSDHNSLEYFNSFKDRSSRLNKLVAKLVDYDFIIKYQKADSPAIRAVDHLSRFPINTLPGNKVESGNETVCPDSIAKDFNFEEKQKEDPIINKLREAVESPNTIKNQKLLRQSRRFSMKNNLLYLNIFLGRQKSFALYVPKSLIPKILFKFHDDLTEGSGHLSFKKCYDRMKKYFYWPNMSVDLQDHIARCHSCNINKPSKKKYGLLEPIPPPLTGKPFSHIICDFLGPLPNSNGKKYILLAICTLTKYAISTATTNADAATVAKFLINDVIAQKGFFRTFSTDRGTHFENELISQLCSQLKTSKQHSTAYRPQCQGLVERLNQTYVNVLKHYTNENNSNWSNILPLVNFTYNSHIQSATGYSPFYLVHGYEPDSSLTASIPDPTPPSDLLESIESLIKIRKELPEIIEKVQNKYKARYDKSHVPLELTPGSQVYVTLTQSNSKLAPLYKGPFMVTRKISDLNYEVTLPMRGVMSKEIIHVSRLKPIPPVRNQSKAKVQISQLTGHQKSERKLSL